MPELITIITAGALVFGIAMFGISRGHSRHRDLLNWHRDLLNQHMQLTESLAHLEEKKRDLSENIQQWFMVEPCSRCNEFEMILLQISPNARSIQYQCLHCEKKVRASAGTPNAFKIRGLFEEAQNLVSKHNELTIQFIQDQHQFLQDKQQYDAEIFGPDLEAGLEAELSKLEPIPYNTVLMIIFQSPAAPLPYEQTSRTPIPEAVRSEVWRRDSGQCVKCGSKHNLQFDHIIPVSLGGATTVANLQLLCQPCNGSKGKKI